ncbi:MAG: adenylyl-sulfate kinase, partial [Flavobacteriales bacterium]|nr:adenylyl-sulfate kinase [Flavobacteriales bacterium]
MKEEKENIFTVFDDILQRKDKEELLNQKSKVIWMTGLSGSGKTTIAKGVERYLHSQGIVNQLLDGDNIRVGISNNLTFSSEDRSENIRRISEVSKLFMNCGIVTLNCFVSPTIAIRQIAKDIIGEENFIEVYINASIETCEDRDVKGLYQKARNGEIKDFT